MTREQEKAMYRSRALAGDEFALDCLLWLSKKESVDEQIARLEKQIPAPTLSPTQPEAQS